MAKRKRKVILEKVEEKLDKDFLDYESIVSVIVTLQKLREDLDKEYEDKKYFEFSFEIDWCYNIIHILGKRYETDEEYKKRCDKLDGELIARKARVKTKKERLKSTTLGQALKLYNGNVQKLKKDLESL